MLSFRIRKSSLSSSGVPTASEIPSNLRFALLLYWSSMFFCSSRDTTLFSRSVIPFSFCSLLCTTVQSLQQENRVYQKVPVDINFFSKF